MPANLTQTGSTTVQRHVRLGCRHRQRRRHGLRHLPRRDLEGHDHRDGHDDLGSRLRHELHRRRRRSRRSRQPLGQGDADRDNGVVPRRHAGADCADQSGRVGHDGELADTLVDGGDRRHRGHRLHPLPRCEPGGNHLRLDVVHLRRPRLRQQLHARRRSVRRGRPRLDSLDTRREHSVVRTDLDNLRRRSRRLRQQLRRTRTTAARRRSRSNRPTRRRPRT